MAQMARITTGYGDCEDCGYYETWIEIHHEDGRFALRYDSDHIASSRWPEFVSPDEFVAELERQTKHYEELSKDEDDEYSPGVVESLSKWADLIARVK